jgi:isocitrate dehydrogenase kinase/phosphatase
MKSRIKKASTLVYSGKTIEVKKSMTQLLVSKYYQLSEESDPKSRMADAWAKYRAFELKTAMQAVERGLYA